MLKNNPIKKVIIKNNNVYGPFTRRANKIQSVI